MGWGRKEDVYNGSTWEVVLMDQEFKLQAGKSYRAWLSDSNKGSCPGEGGARTHIQTFQSSVHYLRMATRVFPVPGTIPCLPSCGRACFLPLAVELTQWLFFE